MVTAERRNEVEHLLGTVERWAHRQTGIRAVAVVGSWARGDARMDSDVDLVVLTDDPSPCLNEDDWVADVTGEVAPVIRTMKWGDIVTERRLRLRSGLEADFSFAPLAWADQSPVDQGTAAVVRNGCQAVFDPDGIIHSLAQAVHARASQADTP